MSGSFSASIAKSTPFSFNALITCGEHAVHALNAGASSDSVSKRAREPRNWCGRCPNGVSLVFVGDDDDDDDDDVDDA
jgi:hypothetical protein